MDDSDASSNIRPDLAVNSQRVDPSNRQHLNSGASDVTEDESTESSEEGSNSCFPDSDFKKQCKEMMRGLLLEIYQEEHVDENLDYFLTGEGHETYYRHPDLSTPEIQEKEEQVRTAANQLHQFYLSYEKLYSTCYLLLNSPIVSTSVHLEEDAKANKVQNENFYKTLHRTDSDQGRNPEAHQVVSTESEVRQAIRQLFQEMSMKTKSMTIVFNGEGHQGDKNHPQGSLCLHGGTPISMERFIDIILSTWNEVVTSLAEQYSTSCSTSPTPDSQTDIPMEIEDDSLPDSGGSNIPPGYNEEVDVLPPIPSSVSVILGQCYSHNYPNKPSLASKWRSKFEVICLTHPDENDGRAQCEVRFDAPFKLRGVIRDVLMANHRELNYFAEKNASVRRTLDPNNLLTSPMFQPDP